MFRGQEQNLRRMCFMLNEILKDFVKIAEVNESLIQKYKELVPSEIITIWKEYGFGTFRNGYFKVINPDDYKALNL